MVAIWQSIRQRHSTKCWRQIWWTFQASLAWMNGLVREAEEEGRTTQWGKVKSFLRDIWEAARHLTPCTFQYIAPIPSILHQHQVSYTNTKYTAPIHSINTRYLTKISSIPHQYQVSRTNTKYIPSTNTKHEPSIGTNTHSLHPLLWGTQTTENVSCEEQQVPPYTNTKYIPNTNPSMYPQYLFLHSTPRITQ